MTARAFWSGVWAELTGMAEHRRNAAYVRTATLTVAEQMIRSACFTHNPQAERGWIDCHCEVADELKRMATTTPTSKES